MFGSGYLANTGIIPALMGEGDLVLVDELAHACVWAGARMTKGTVVAFRHNDVAHAGELLAEHRAVARHAMIATDGVFSMDGDLAPLAELGDRLAEAHDAWLLADDAHGIGVVGGGRGSAFAGAREANVHLQMGTLSKAIGQLWRLRVRQRPGDRSSENAGPYADLFHRSAAASVAAAIAALDVIESEPEYCALPLAQSPRVRACDRPSRTAKSHRAHRYRTAEEALEAQQTLEKEGFLIIAIRPPTVPAGTARLRMAFTAQHADADIARLAKTVRTGILNRA